MANQFIIRRTTAEWVADNPVLLDNQLGVESNIVNNVETDDLLAKLGNGIDKWNDLPYWPPGIDGDVQGPSSATDNAIARFDSTTGKAIQNSSVTISDAGLLTAPWVQTSGGSRAAADVTTVSITPAAITGLSATLVAGQTYSGRLVVMCAAATAADGFRFDFDGGVATATNFRAMGTIADTASVRPLAMTSALATDLVDTTTTGDAIAVIDFTITCNAAGTLIPRFAKEVDAAGATNTVYRGSYMLITDVA